MDLAKLAEPFPLEDLEWRVSHAGRHGSRIWCKVLVYVTARAHQQRLDKVCGPENWKTELPTLVDVNGVPAFVVGISIRINDEWVTKYDVCEAVAQQRIPPAKTGFSGGEKRAGCQWGIARYLHYVKASNAEVAETEPAKQDRRNWNKAELKDGTLYFWKPPRMSASFLPKDPGHEVSKEEVAALVLEWRAKFAPDVESSAERRQGFTRFVHSVAGEFPIADHTCWTKEALVKCRRRIKETTDPNGPSADVPFEGAEE